MEKNYVVTYNIQDGYTGFTTLEGFEQNKEAFENDLTIVFQFNMVDHLQPTETDWNGLKAKAHDVWENCKKLNQRLGFYPHWQSAPK